MNYSKRALKIWLIAVWIFIPRYSNCQIEKVDSLKSLLTSGTIEQQTDVLLELGKAYGDANYDTSYLYFNQACKLAYILGDSLRIVRAVRGKGQLYRRLGKLDSAIILLTKILPIAKRNPFNSETKAILNATGVAYTMQAKYDDALRDLFESLELREIDNNQFEISTVLNNIGFIYLMLSDFDKALYYYHRTLRLIEDFSLGPKDFMLLNIGICYAHQGDHVQAQAYLKQVASMCKNEGCADHIRILLNQSFGILSSLMSKPNEAKVHFLKAYKLSKNSAHERYHLGNLQGLIDVYLSLHELDTAQYYLKEAEKICVEGSSYSYEMSGIFEQIISFYKKTKNFEKVAQYQDKLLLFKTDMYDNRLSNLMKIEGAHLERENVAKIEAQEKVMMLNREVLKRQGYLNVVIGLVVVLLGALTIILIWNNRQVKRMNYLLDIKVKQRTEELELNRDTLLRAFEQRDLAVVKAASDIRSSVATIKGLCFLGRRDIDDAMGYFEKMNVVSDHFVDVVNKLVGKSV